MIRINVDIVGQFYMKQSCVKVFRIVSFINSYMVVFIFFAVFTTAESKSAPVCPGSAWPPYRHVTAASVHYLTGSAGPAG